LQRIFQDMQRYLPSDHIEREPLYSELHARPAANIELPALVLLIAVLNEAVPRSAELAHLQRLPGQAQLSLASLESNFLRLQFDNYSLKWERHSEFTRYSMVIPLPAGTQLDADPVALRSSLGLDAQWLSAIPGHTMTAIDLWMLSVPWDDKSALLNAAKRWMQPQPDSPSTHSTPVLASLVGRDSHSMAVCDFQLRSDGFERMLVLAPTSGSPLRAGRVAQRLQEIETYRLMALRGLPAAKLLAPQLAQWEDKLAQLSLDIVNQSLPEEPLLGNLVALAAAVEKAITTHAYRFSATQAYHSIVQQRLSEIREKNIDSTQTLGAFLHRRLDPAMATVNATQRRLTELSQRISRTSALLRTRVDIATEKQNQQLLEKLTRGQQLQLRLQTTVEGLSIAAVSYYAVSLILYAAKALEAAGAPINPEVLTGALIPLVIGAVWFATRRIHRKLMQ
jgi:uncharacterized membrane-anchored protein